MKKSQAKTTQDIKEVSSSNLKNPSKTLNKDGPLNLKNLSLGVLFPLLAALVVGYLALPSAKLPISNQDQAVNTFQEPSDPYNFDNPFLAYHLLAQLDEFEPVNPKYYDYMPTAKNSSTVVYMGLHIDEQYCDKHRAVFVSDPKSVLEGKNALMDWWPTNSVRKTALAGVVDDLQTNVSSKVPKDDKIKRFSWIDPRQNYFFITLYFHVYQHLGKNFGCTTQAYNHIPGDGHMNRKDLISESIVKYSDSYKAKPQCFSYDKAFPRTWVMYIEKQCKEFFAHFHSAEYKRLKELNSIVYIKKVGAGAHNGKGVYLMDDEEEKNMTQFYDGGKKCGKVKDNLIMQYFVPNPLLLSGHKFDFRVYLLVASVNPLLAYYYDGYLKVSLQKYEKNSNDTSAMFTNTMVSTEVIKKANGTLHNGMNKTELEYFQRWDFERFQKYLLEAGVVTDPNWLDNHLRPEFKKAMIHLVRMSQEYFLKRSAVYEMFGVDFMLDENLNLWFIEVNSSPSLAPTYPESALFIRKHMQDLYEIVMGMTRSRAKRIVKYINELTKRGGFQVGLNGELIVDNLSKYREEFKKVTMNSFEPEFEPSAGNGYQKIIDESINGPARYMGFIDEVCL